MESQGNQVARKRFKSARDEKEGEVGGGIVDQVGGGEEEGQEEEEEAEIGIAGSEEMEFGISRIHQKIEHFTQLVSQLLESGKAFFKDLSNEFEEKIIMIHKEQMEKWQEEIRELRLLDASNEEVNALLHNARCLLQNVHFDS